LAQSSEPLSDDIIRQHRAVALADSVEQGGGLTVGMLPGQDVFTVSDMPAKVEAHIRGLGVGFLPEPLARPYIDSGKLFVKRVERAEHELKFGYAWRDNGRTTRGRALQWWLEQIQNPVSRAALLAGRAAGV
jgi:DNA-binding transcriptional LysR family regulator